MDDTKTVIGRAVPILCMGLHYLVRLGPGSGCVSCGICSTNLLVLLQEARLTTEETLRTPLTLLVAFPRLPTQGAPEEPLRCGPAPPDSAALGGTVSRARVSWGQLYADRGDQVPTPRHASHCRALSLHARRSTRLHFFSFTVSL